MVHPMGWDPLGSALEGVRAFAPAGGPCLGLSAPLLLPTSVSVVTLDFVSASSLFPQQA